MGAKVQKRCEKRKVKRELFAYPLHFLFLFHNSLVVWEIGRFSLLHYELCPLLTSLCSLPPLPFWGGVGGEAFISNATYVPYGFSSFPGSAGCRDWVSPQWARSPQSPVRRLPVPRASRGCWSAVAFCGHPGGRWRSICAPHP